jgi:hypothetical protein
MQKGWHYLGYVTMKSLATGCPMAVGSAVSNHTPLASKAEARRIAKRQRLRDVTFHSAATMADFRALHSNGAAKKKPGVMARLRAIFQTK